MGPTVEIRVLELLCSRLCHELISPVSAINNGVELLSEDPGDMLADITGLLGHSAGQAAAVLKFYRLAYGLGGDEAPAISLGDAGGLMEGLIGDGKVTLHWPDGGAPGTSIGRVATKLLLNASVLALDALPRGGEVSVTLDRTDGLSITLRASGQGAARRDEYLAALSPGVAVADLTPRSVQAYFTRFLAEAAGGAMATAQQPDGPLTISLRPPAAPPDRVRLDRAYPIRIPPETPRGYPRSGERHGGAASSGYPLRLF